MRFISHHITPLVINSLGGGHRHTHIQTRTHTHIHIQMIHTKAILRNQARAGLWPARAWFNNVTNHVNQLHLNVCTRIEAGLTNVRKRVAWNDVTKHFLFHKAVILTNSLDSLKHWNIKYIIKVKKLLVALVPCQPSIELILKGWMKKAKRCIFNKIIIYGHVKAYKYFKYIY